MAIFATETKWGITIEQTSFTVHFAPDRYRAG